MKTFEQLMSACGDARQEELLRRAEVLFGPMGDRFVEGIQDDIRSGKRTQVTGVLWGGLGVPKQR